MESLTRFEDDRKCFQLLNDVLVEMTVKQVIPDLEMKEKNIIEIISKLVESLKRREADMIEFQQTYKEYFVQPTAAQ